MPDGNMSVVDVGKLAKPVDTLVKKVSAAVGGLYKPRQIKRVAKAEAAANLIKAKSDIEITDLERRAMHRFVEEETMHQKNMEEITEKAFPLLKSESDPNLMDNDWITNFFDKSRIVSDTEMQNLWAKVLAGEANKPGSFSKSTVNFLGELDKKEAEQFSNLCGFVWTVNGPVLAIFNIEDQIYNNKGINFGAIAHLDSIGLIQFDHLAGYNIKDFPVHATVHYYGQQLRLNFENKKNVLSVGCALFTVLLRFVPQ